MAVVSELRKISHARADKNVAKWADSAFSTDLYLSAITIQELEIGVLLVERRDSAQGTILRTWLENQVLPAFAGRILVVDTAIAQRHASCAGSCTGMTVAITYSQVFVM